MPPTYTSRPPADREITHPPPENHRTPGIRTVTCGSTGIAAVIIADGTARPPPKFPDRFSDAPSRPTPRKQISQSRTHANSGAPGGTHRAAQVRRRVPDATPLVDPLAAEHHAEALGRARVVVPRRMKRHGSARRVVGVSRLEQGLH